MCLEMDDIKATCNALLGAGASGQGSMPMSSGSAGDARAAYLRDPNGILIELVQFAPKHAVR